MSNQDYIKIDFSHFPNDERCAQVPDKVFMVDNLDMPAGEKYNHEYPKYPVQITMAISFLLTDGEINMTIGLEKYTLKKGQSLMIIPGTFFQISSVSDDVRCLFMAIAPDFINYAQDVKLGVEFGRRLKDNPITTVPKDDIEDMLALYRLVKKKLTDKDFQFKEDVAKSFLNIAKCNIFQKIIESSDIQKTEKPSNRKEEIFYTFLALVRDNYKSERCIAFYADRMCMSPKYLSSVVHNVGGKYATDWINDYVILEAKALLRSPGISVKDVANSLNFANQSFFAKFFRQHTGYTPKEYMNM